MPPRIAYNRTPPEIESKIIEMYKTMNASQIFKETGICQSTVINILTRNNIKVRSQSESCQKLQFDKTYFKKIDSKEKAQFLGMIYTDGNVHVSKTHSTFSINVAVQDKEYLEKLNKFIKNERSLLVYDPGNLGINGVPFETYQHIARLSVSNIEICQDLIKLGVFPRKSEILKFPTVEQVPDEFLKDFILGAFEGDGGIYADNQLHFTLTGTHDFLSGCFNCIKKNVEIEGRLAKRNDHRFLYDIVISGNKQVIRLMDWLYSDCSFYMERKYSFYQGYKKKYLEWRVDNLPITEETIPEQITKDYIYYYFERHSSLSLFSQKGFVKAEYSTYVTKENGEKIFNYLSSLGFKIRLKEKSYNGYLLSAIFCTQIIEIFKLLDWLYDNKPGDSKLYKKYTELKAKKEQSCIFSDNFSVMSIRV